MSPRRHRGDDEAVTCRSRVDVTGDLLRERPSMEPIFIQMVDWPVFAESHGAIPLGSLVSAVTLSALIW
jgi:hypothetical protein